MAATSAAGAAAVESSVSSEEQAAKVVHKRFEGLVMVRTKAIKGKGAWYWTHLEPILVHNSDNGLPKAVKLRCSLCDAVFSASNPSRTASEHLKRGTCPNFASAPKPISSAPPPPPLSVASLPQTAGISPSSSRPPHSQRKRRGAAASANNSGGITTASLPAHQFVPPLAIVDPSRFTVDLAFPPAVSISAPTATAVASPVAVGGFPGQQQMVLSGGKEDLGALAKLENSVKRLKSPKTSAQGPSLNKAQVDSALDLLSDWVYECCGSVSFSSLDHPKFKAFLNQVGLPGISRRELVGSRLDSKYEEAKAESEAKIRDAMFFQVAAEGWKSRDRDRDSNVGGDDNFVHLAVNLPNGTSVFRRTVFTSSFVPSKYTEEIFLDTITEICGSNVHQCVGIVSDKYKAKALRDLENQHHWMVNICCQYQGFQSLIKDFGKDLPLFKNEYGRAALLRLPLHGYKRSDFGAIYSVVEDILSSARALQLVLSDESYKVSLMEDPTAREIEEMMRNPQFWNELEAVHSLVKLIRSMAQEIETEKPRIGQCLPLWEELRQKVKEWCSKFHVVEGHVEKVIDRRFKKNYHPSWSAAFILDPLYLMRDASGKYLPPFKFLTPEQEKDVDKLITRLVMREEAHIALMELMKWRTEGLDPVYAQAVQLRQRDPNTGKMKIANPQSSRLVWETHLSEFKSLGKVAVRLIFLHATSRGFKCNWSLLKWASAHCHSRVGMERAQKLIFISAHLKMEKRESSSSSGYDEDKDIELFALENGEDDVLNEVFVDTSSV
ncbi:uncharacterized protein LOC127240280 isoform X3 [Andrographis paniculata]|uniref:uncharacterized protein LOC127240280 isoform X3 n=1 Tax=Andrographis paniculata TaxID=175694 RepID=UPI0021E80FC6|nr:uncharacterized protein LOC127240280 isoform X3 [Andrographis paniculata]